MEDIPTKVTLVRSIRKLSTSDKSSFDNKEEETERTTNLFYLVGINGLESVTRIPMIRYKATCIFFFSVNGPQTTA